MRVEDVLTNNHRRVLNLAESRTVADAIKEMTATGADALIVTTDRGPAGIFTRSDVMRASVDSPRKSLAAIPLKEAMSADIVSAEPGDDTARAVDVMLRAGVAYLPIRADGQIVAILPIRDLVACHLEALNHELEQLQDYIDQLHESYHD